MIRVTSKLFGEIQVPLTEWECPTDIQYEEVNGKLIEIN